MSMVPANTDRRPPTMVTERKADNGNGAVTIIAPPALVIQNYSEAFKLAELMANCNLVPKELQGKPANCLMVIQLATRWEMDPFAVAQECSVIQGKLAPSGKLTAAVINVRGNLREPLSFVYSGNGDQRGITVSGIRQGEAIRREVEVKLRDAKTNNKVWQTQPDQQLAYHGARVWARRWMPELMLGVWSKEEFDEKEKAGVDGTGWPTGDLEEEGDHDGGTPERDTKPEEPKTFSRDQRAKETWRDREREFIDEINMLRSTTDHEQWVFANFNDVKLMPLDYRKRVVERLDARLKELEAERVVHDTDDVAPRPARSDDFVDPPPLEENGIAARAMEQMRGRPSRTLHAVEPPDDVTELLR